MRLIHPSLLIASREISDAEKLECTTQVSIMTRKHTNTRVAAWEDNLETIAESLLRPLSLSARREVLAFCQFRQKNITCVVLQCQDDDSKYSGNAS